MMNLIISEFVRDINTLPVWINFAATFWAFGSVLFLITLAMRGLFVYKESYLITMRMTIVVVCFGGELIMTHYPDIFMIHMANIVFAVGGALIGRWIAEAWAGHREKLVRNAKVTASIMERYKKDHTPDEIAEAITE